MIICIRVWLFCLCAGLHAACSADCWHGGRQSDNTWLHHPVRQHSEPLWVQQVKLTTCQDFQWYTWLFTSDKCHGFGSQSRCIYFLEQFHRNVNLTPKKIKLRNCLQWEQYYEVSWIVKCMLGCHIVTIRYVVDGSFSASFFSGVRLTFLWNCSNT